jgi:hypothetical protein
MKEEEHRIDLIANSHGDGEHYSELLCCESGLYGAGCMHDNCTGPKRIEHEEATRATKPV